MLDDPLMDPTGPLVSELRADLDLASLVSTRVAAGEPKPDKVVNGVIVERGYARGPGEYVAFVVITGAPAPMLSVPVSRSTYGVRCYGATFQNATAVWGAVVKALHRVGPRVKASGLGIYLTVLDESAEPGKDPDTNQPYIEGTIRIIATAQAVTA